MAKSTSEQILAILTEGKNDEESHESCSSMPSSDEDPDFLMFKDRPEWKDVQPLQLEADGDSVMRIPYSESFKDCFGYLRAVLRTNELSERVFELTTRCVAENPSCYTLWLLRRKLIQHLNKDIKQEIDFMTKHILRNQKNYQVWYHRQKLVEWLDKSDGELEFIRKTLKADAKNYHAWQYRQWVVTTFKKWQGELEFCDSMLKDDIRNNSAWNHRYYVIQKTSGFTEEVVQNEINYTIESAKEATYNESAWNYLRGLLDFATPNQRVEVLEQLEGMRVASVLPCVHLCSLLLSMYEDKGDKEQAIELAVLLQTEDFVRKQYWIFKEKMIAAAPAAQ